jgi:limonene 1,2-monooxygenase
MEESFDVMMRLFAGETVTAKTDWFTCDDAVLQVRPYSNFDVAVASSISPSGSKLAGRYGTGLLSIAATEPAAFQVLDYNFQVWTEEATRNGHVADRSAWRLMGPMHVAETVEQAKDNCRYGLQWVFNYLSHIIPIGDPSAPPPPSDYDEFVDFANESGRMVIGTPEMAIEQLRRLEEKTGGFGAYLFLGADIADWAATKHSYELFAYEVMPHFTGQAAPVQASYDHVIGQGTRWVDATIGAQLSVSGIPRSWSTSSAWGAENLDEDDKRARLDVPSTPVGRAVVTASGAGAEGATAPESLRRTDRSGEAHAGKQPHGPRSGRLADGESPATGEALRHP